MLTQANTDRELVSITLNDVTLREGDQAPLTSFDIQTKQIVALMLSEMWIRNIEAGFGNSRVDMPNIQAVARVLWEADVSIWSLGRALWPDTLASIEALDGVQNPRIHIVMATSDEHIEAKFREKWETLEERREWVLSQIRAEVARARKHSEKFPNTEVELSPEDATGNALVRREDGKRYLDFESDQFRFLIRVIRESIIQGANIINTPDTLWNLLPHDTEAFFRKLHGETKDLRDQYRFDFSHHIHNDAASATANAIAAIRGWARQIEVTIAGIGERTGNTKLHEIIGIINNHGHQIVPGAQVVFAHPIRTKLVWPVTRFVQWVLQLDPFLQTPFIGSLSDVDGSWIHNAAVSVYGWTKNKWDFWGQDMEEFFSPRWGSTQVAQILKRFWVDFQRDDIFTTLACAEAEKVRTLYPSRIYALYLASQWRYTPPEKIHISERIASAEFKFDGQRIQLLWAGDEGNGPIDGIINAINVHFRGEKRINIRSMKITNKPPLQALVKDFFKEVESSGEALSEWTSKRIHAILEPLSHAWEWSEQDAIVDLTLEIDGVERNIRRIGSNTEEIAIRAIIDAALPLFAQNQNI
jgi:isopropylmalate/homocitrate/citramalate synthase